MSKRMECKYGTEARQSALDSVGFLCYPACSHKLWGNCNIKNIQTGADLDVTDVPQSLPSVMSLQNYADIHIEIP